MRIRAPLVALATAGILATTGALRADDSSPDYLKAKPEAVEAWKDMRFGMFICWGPVTLMGQEIGWSRAGRPGQTQGGKGPIPIDVYDALYKKWKPDRFDAKQWVKVAQDMGAKYIIFLVKHHDGFCLYDTKLTDYRSTGPESAWKHDVMKDVADACHAAGMRLIVYYSQPDWHHPDHRTANHARYIEYFHGQIRELLTRYGKIDGLWFDLGGKPQDWDTENLLKMARSIQPWLVINNRVGVKGDFDTPEQRVGKCQFDRPWESCITLGTSWSWRPSDRLKSYADAVQMLVACAVGDGNLALNTNPMPDGQIEPRQVEIFQKIGQWLAKYGDSIYGTRGGPFMAPDMGGRKISKDSTHFAAPNVHWWGGSTRKGNTVYLHILRWPDETLALPPIPRKIVGYSVLTGGEAAVKQTERGIEVSVPAPQRDAIDTIVKLELDGPASAIELPVVKLASGSIAFGKKATASNYFQNNAAYAPGKAFDDDLDSRWGCDKDTHAAWLEVDLGEPKTFDHAMIGEYHGRVRKFELRVKQDDGWKTVHRGTTIGDSLDITFGAITGQYVRLELLKTTDGPSICEFQLFAPK
jgi:alpha-L-fucosidase